jgi:hypothetical protein
MNNEFDKRQAAARTSAAARKRLEEMRNAKRLTGGSPKFDHVAAVGTRAGEGDAVFALLAREEMGGVCISPP